MQLFNWHSNCIYILNSHNCCNVFAVNIPRGLIEMKLAPTNDNEGLDANTPLIVYCGGGSRASLAGKTLRELGFKNVQNLDGGFRGWKEFSS